jgi:hypothetical protein
MGFGLDPKQIVSSEELLMSQVVSQEATIRLLLEKGLFSKEEFLKMVEVVNFEIESAKNIPKLA